MHQNKTKFKLRPYQEFAAKSAIGIIETDKSALIVAPTGAGKTAIGCKLVEHYVNSNFKCLWLAHRSELIQQASQRLRQDYSIAHGVIQAGVYSGNQKSNVQIASVQTLSRSNYLNKVDMIIIDEAHHSTAESYLKITKAYPNAKLVGLTATPWRLTGKSLGYLFDEVIPVSNYSDLIKEQYLVTPRLFIPSCAVDFSAATLKFGEFNEIETSRILLDNKIIGDVYAEWEKYAVSGDHIRSTIVFANNIEHSLKIVKKFRSKGVLAEHIDGETPQIERIRILKDLENGKIKVVSNVYILSEGFDCPRVSCVILARPTASKTLYLQMVGRALRPCKEINKTDCIILDHTGNALRHGTVEDTSNYNIHDSDWVEIDTKLKPKCKICPKCNSVISLNAYMCRFCGQIFQTSARKDIAITPGTLTEISSKSNKKFSIPELLELMESSYDAPTQNILDIQNGIKSLNQSEHKNFILTALSKTTSSKWLELIVQLDLCDFLSIGFIGLIAKSFQNEYDNIRTALSLAKGNEILSIASLFHYAGIAENTHNNKLTATSKPNDYIITSMKVAAAYLSNTEISSENKNQVVDLIKNHGITSSLIERAMIVEDITEIVHQIFIAHGKSWKIHIEYLELLCDYEMFEWILDNMDAIESVDAHKLVSKYGDEDWFKSDISHIMEQIENIYIEILSQKWSKNGRANIGTKRVSMLEVYDERVNALIDEAKNRK